MTNVISSCFFIKASQSSRPQARKKFDLFFPAARSASPRGTAAAAYAKNMPPACFLNAAAAGKTLLGPQVSELAAYGVPAATQRSGCSGERRGNGA
ncbi:MAG: hypothetical protein J6J81_02205, partial [Oscillospiraceae bacterium]|nr:hypothetical protein [Oscillospiraceae bacterium]